MSSADHLVTKHWLNGKRGFGSGGLAKYVNVSYVELEGYVSLMVYKRHEKSAVNVAIIFIPMGPNSATTFISKMSKGTYINFF